MTTLVTGGHGFLGSRVATRLRGSSDDVVTPSRKELELTNSEAVEKYLRDNSVTTIVHLAGAVDRREVPEAQNKQWHDTFEATRSLLFAAAASGVASVIAAGTLDEVGKVEGVVGPDTPAAPLTTYGLCKNLGLQTAMFLAERSKMRVEWFRPTAIYGPGQDGPMLVPSAFATAIGEGEGRFTSGEQKRDFIYVDDVVDWIARAAQITEGDPGVRVHHVGSGKGTAVKDVLSTIARLTGANFELGAIPRREGEPDLVIVPEYHDDRLPLKEWKAQIDFAEGLERTYKWWQTK